VLDGLVLAVGWELANLVFREPLWFKRGYAALFGPSSPSNYSRMENGCQCRVFPHVECYWDGIIPSNDNAAEGALSIEAEMTVDERCKGLRKAMKPHLPAELALDPPQPLAGSGGGGEEMPLLRLVVLAISAHGGPALPGHTACLARKRTPRTRQGVLSEDGF
jgi:hypothetical protein